MKVLDVKYAEATVKQLARARTMFNKSHGLASDSKAVIKNPLEKGNFEAYPSYDKKGKLTLVGKAKRLTDLKNKGLKENATVGEYLTKAFENLKESIVKICKNVNKHYTKDPHLG